MGATFYYTLHAKTSVTFFVQMDYSRYFVTNKQMEVMQELIGNNIAKMRKAQGLTQDNLASYLGLSRVQVSHFERGERDISVTDLNKLSDLFGIELSELLEEDLKIQNLNLAFAFRNENPESDLEQIASFKKVVMNYLKMERINAL